MGMGNNEYIEGLREGNPNKEEEGEE